MEKRKTRVCVETQRWTPCVIIAANERSKMSASCFHDYDRVSNVNLSASNVTRRLRRIGIVRNPEVRTFQVSAAFASEPQFLTFFRGSRWFAVQRERHKEGPRHDSRFQDHDHSILHWKCPRFGLHLSPMATVQSLGHGNSFSFPFSRLLLLLLEVTVTFCTASPQADWLK